MIACVLVETSTVPQQTEAEGTNGQPRQRPCPGQQRQHRGITDLSTPCDPGAVDAMEYAPHERHGEDCSQRQGEQWNRELRIAELIILFEYRDVRRPHAEGEAIRDKKRRNSFSRGCCRTLLHRSCLLDFKLH
jgi:hypothetical protein